MSIRSGIRGGLLVAGIVIFLILIGVPTLVGTMVQEWFDLEGQVAGAWVVLIGMGLVAG